MSVFFQWKKHNSIYLIEFFVSADYCFHDFQPRLLDLIIFQPIQFNSVYSAKSQQMSFQAKLLLL